MGHIGRFNFVLLFGMILTVPLIINYYVIKILITFLSFSFINWGYSLIELLYVTITCFLLGYLIAMYVQSKRMIVVSMEQDGTGTPFVKITFHNKNLMKNTARVKIVWDFEQEIIHTINNRSKLNIPYDSSGLNVIKGPKSIKFIDNNGYVIYKTKTV